MWGHWLKKMFSEWANRSKWPQNTSCNQASCNTHSEVELSLYQQLLDGDKSTPRAFLQGQSAKSQDVDLDAFFGSLYKYYCEKGLWCVVTQWVVELLSLGFTICFSAFALLIVDWNVLQTCGVKAIEPCDLHQEALKEHPFHPITITKSIVLIYLLLFSLYWVFSFLHFFAQLRQLLGVRRFYHHSLHVSDQELQTTPWHAVLNKVVRFQREQGVWVARELTAHDVVMRIMRKENYLIGMLNKGVLAVALPAWVPGSGPVTQREDDGTERRLLLTKTLEWSLNWCILQYMFDRNFLIRKDFVNNPLWLKRRLRVVGIIIFILSPFLIIFMFVYFFLRHAEEFYHHPSTAASRRWANLARWMFREFNEVEHVFNQRLNCSYKHAVEYMRQFPSMILSLLAKFVSFVAGGFAAILIIMAFLDESLLQSHLFGRNLFWYAAVFGTITAICRSFIIEEFQVFEPEKSLKLVACFTHYMPKHWRGAENKDNVRAEFESLFQYTSTTLLEDLISIFVTPYTLLLLLPKHVGEVLQFVQKFTMHIEGVGDVCSLSMFDFEHHGNRNYGSPFHTDKEMRSCQGKMEKSFLSFQSSYPEWEPPVIGKQFLSILANFKFQAPIVQLTHVSQGFSFARQALDDVVNVSYVQPQHGATFPLSLSQSVKEQHALQQYGQCREEASLSSSKLMQDQLYWIVDQFYASHSPQRYHSKSTVFQHVPQRYLDTESWPYLIAESADDLVHDRTKKHVAVPDHEHLGMKEKSEDEEYKESVQLQVTSLLAHESFLEPPMFGAGHFVGSGYDSSSGTEEDQERAWNVMYPPRARTDSSIDDKASDLDLPFGDLYDQPQKGHNWS